MDDTPSRRTAPDAPDAPDTDTDVRYEHRARDAALVAQVQGGDSGAFGTLYDLWFDRVFDLSFRILRDREIAAEVTQDTFLSAWNNIARLRDPNSFGGWLLRIARNASFNRSEREHRSHAVDGQELAVIESVGAAASNAPDGFRLEDSLGRAGDPALAMEDSEMQELVWESARALGPRDAEVLDLQLRHGLTPAEVGEVLGMNRNAANQLVHRVRGRLDGAVRARVLWRGGHPRCEVLERLLLSAGISQFDADAARLITRHADGCEVCERQRVLGLEPVAMFAALPLLVAPELLKQHCATALEAAGVGLGGSVFASVLGTGAGGGGVGVVSSVLDSTQPAGGHVQNVQAGVGRVSQVHAQGSGSGGGGGSGGMGDGMGGGAGDDAATSLPKRLILAGSGGALTLALVLLLLLKACSPPDPTVLSASLTSLPSAASSSTSVIALPNILPPPATDPPPLVDPPQSTPDDPGATAPPLVLTVPTSPTTIASSPRTLPTTSPTTGVPGVTVTTLPTTVTFPVTIPPPTTVLPSISFAMSPSTGSSGGWPMVAGSRSAPTLGWTVSGGSPGYTVSVHGPYSSQPDVVLGSGPSGSVVVCPGQVAVAAARCTTSAGSYQYLLDVIGPDATVWATRTTTLTVV